MPKKNSKRCKGCGDLFVPEKEHKKVCLECRELLALGDTKDILEFERLRNRYNTQYSASLTYGQFEQYIINLKAKLKK